eukprot:scaffold74911_cov35-Tisochrysis_lutea.AAC.3
MGSIKQELLEWNGAKMAQIDSLVRIEVHRSSCPIVLFSLSNGCVTFLGPCGTVGFKLRHALSCSGESACCRTPKRSDHEVEESNLSEKWFDAVVNS